jgi:hypothetical protein
MSGGQVKAIVGEMRGFGARSGTSVAAVQMLGRGVKRVLLSAAAGARQTESVTGAS